MAGIDRTKAYLDISLLNKLITSNDKHCDIPKPIKRPTINAIKPTTTVS